jgi:phytoene synthase
LPASVRDPALALYAFCRVADDEVDENDKKLGAVQSLRDRLELIYAGRPRNAPSDRAFAAVVEEFEMPRLLPEALLEGLAWDAEGRRYRTLSELFDYCARVASAVGAMMAVLMRVRDADALARACDLGLAMQLTNIARDVGEDARARRLFLPLDWMARRASTRRVLCRTAAIRGSPRHGPPAAARGRTVLQPLRGGRRGTAAFLPARHLRGPPHLCRHRRGDSPERLRHDQLARPHHKGQKIGWLGLSTLRAG